jgi:hypothetical protein
MRLWIGYSRTRTMICTRKGDGKFGGLGVGVDNCIDMSLRLQTADYAQNTHLRRRGSVLGTASEANMLYLKGSQPGRTWDCNPGTKLTRNQASKDCLPLALYLERRGVAACMVKRQPMSCGQNLTRLQNRIVLTVNTTLAQKPRTPKPSICQK